MADPTQWALDRARAAFPSYALGGAESHLRDIAAALDAARIEAITETEAIVREGLAARGLTWPTEDDLDFGGALDLAMVRALDAAREEGRREALDTARTLLDDVIGVLDQAREAKNSGRA